MGKQYSFFKSYESTEVNFMIKKFYRDLTTSEKEAAVIFSAKQLLLHIREGLVVFPKKHVLGKSEFLDKLKSAKLYSVINLSGLISDLEVTKKEYDEILDIAQGSAEVSTYKPNGINVFDTVN